MFTDRDQPVGDAEEKDSKTDIEQIVHKCASDLYTVYAVVSQKGDKKDGLDIKKT